MKYFQYPVLLLLAILYLNSCNSAQDTVIVAGQVVEANSNNAIIGAVVEVTQPDNLQGKTAVTDSSGHFSFDFEIEETVTITLEIAKQSYESATTSFKLTSQADIRDLDIPLRQPGDSDSSGDNNDDDGGDGSTGDSVGGKSGGPASLTLKSISANSINVAETGGTVHSAFTFEVQDSAGRVVDTPTEVHFNVIRGPGGGESIKPLQTSTGVNNPDGQVTSSLFSGDSSGTVRIEAFIERPQHNLTIRSTPVLISISSGFPDAGRFNVEPRVHNFDGYGINQESHTNNITASVGDLKGNPVKEGTAVYFSASNGGLVNGSATTNTNGYASVNLSANGSRPANHPLGPGYIDVIAQTIDKNNNYIEKTTTLLLTSPRAFIDVTPATLDITNGGSQNFDITITDENGYPMAANTTISVEVGEGLTASGDIIDHDLGDYFEPGEGTTEFSVTVSDDNPDEALSTDGSFTIKVEAPSGEVTSKTIKGGRAKIQ